MKHKYWWIKSNGEAVEISKEKYSRFHRHNLEYQLHEITNGNYYTIVEQTQNHLNIQNRNWMPDISVEVLRKILLS